MIKKEDLIKVKRIINSPEKWTRYAYARDCYGADVIATSPHAVCFCLLGAFSKAGLNYEDHIFEFQQLVFVSSLSDFNDNHSYEEVIELLNKGIELAAV